MSETKVTPSNDLLSRVKKVSTARDETPQRTGDMNGEGDGSVRTFEFEGCSANFGVVLENREFTSPSRSRSTLGNVRIANILPDSPVKREGNLKLGDRVLEINGHDLSKASIERARWYLSSAVRSGKVTMTVRHDLNERNDPPVVISDVMPRERNAEAVQLGNVVKKIHVLKDSRGLGVQISMKVNHVTRDSGVFVSDVSPGGAAARDGRLKEGDELLSINGHSLIGVTQQHAIDLLRASPKLIQMIISTQEEKSVVERKGPLRGRSESQGNLHTTTANSKKNQMARKLPRAPSADNVLNRKNKMSFDRTMERDDIKDKLLRKDKKAPADPDKLLLERGRSRTVDHNISDSENNNGPLKTAELLHSYEQNGFAEKNNYSSDVTNAVAERRSSSSSSENVVDPLKPNSRDVILSKAEESPDSEPVTLEDKPLSNGLPSSPSVFKTTSPVIDTEKKQNLLRPVPITSSGMMTNDRNLSPGQSSPSLPRPQSPGNMGIAFPARYLGTSSPNIVTIGVPTPIKPVGSNDRDSPQAKRRGSSDVPHRKSSTEEEVVRTVVLVKGMGKKGLGFTIVGGKGSPHGDLPVYVKSILSGGAAEADGRLTRGDELLSVNGTSFQGFTHKEALDTFKNLRRGIVTLKVKRNGPGTPSLSAFTTPRTSPGSSRRHSRDVTEETSSSSNSSSPTMLRKLRQRRSKKEKNTEVVLYKEPGSSLGIGLGELNPLESSQIQGIFVQCIIEGSPAAKDGRLRHGDQLLEVNDKKLTGLSVEKVYDILDKVPPGKIYIKVSQREATVKIPSRLNDALTKLQSERQLLEKKMANKPMSTGPASTLSGESGNSDSCDNMTSLSSSSDPLIPHSTQQKKKHKSHPVQASGTLVSSNDPEAAENVEDIYNIIKQPNGELGMGVTIDKSRGNTIVEGVSVKSVTEGGSAALARSPRAVGLRPGDEIVEVNSTHLKGMDQEDVIKIFRDLPSSTLMKIRRSRARPEETDGSPSLITTKEDELIQKTPSSKAVPLFSTPPVPSSKAVPLNTPLVPLLDPPASRQRSGSRNRVATLQEDIYSQTRGADVPSSVSPETSNEKGQSSTAQEKLDPKNDRQPRQESNKSSEEQYSPSSSEFVDDLRIVSREPKEQELGDSNVDLLRKSGSPRKKSQEEISIPNGYRKMVVNIRKPANSTLGLSLVPSSGKLKGYFQIRRLLSGMVCAQDGQLHIGDRIVSVNGSLLKGVAHSMALQLLKKPTELVSFVVLREGLGTLREPSLTASSKSKRESTTEALVASENRKRSLPAPIMEYSQGTSQSTDSSELRQNNISTQSDKLSESQSVENTQDHPPELPYSPPPPPVFDTDSLLDNDLFIPPPSFSPPPPPLHTSETSESEVDSTIPVVSPPPQLSPRMKNFLEQDLLNPEGFHGLENGLDHVQDLKSNSTLQDGWKDNMLHLSETVSTSDYQGCMELPSSIGTYGNDNVYSAVQASVANDALESVDSRDFSGSFSIPPPVVPIDNKISIKNSSQKTVKQAPLQKSVDPILPVCNKSSYSSEPAIDGHALSSGDLENSASPLAQTGHGQGKKGYEPALSELHQSYTSDQSKTNVSSKSDAKDECDAAKENTKEVDVVKPVVGRRVENVPFLIVYQKKFRSLGIKVDLSVEGKVIVTEVSSFGLVGKDGNIRVGDTLVSLNDIFLDGMPTEEVLNLIKTCPRGDVRVVAQAGQKSPEVAELNETIPVQRSESPQDFQVSSLQDKVDVGQPRKMSFLNDKNKEDDLQDQLSGSEFSAVKVDMPSELLSQGNVDIVGKIPTYSLIANERELDQPSSAPITSPPQSGAKTSKAERKGRELDDFDIDDVPPSIPPPPVPEVEQMSKVESSSSFLDESLPQDIVQDDSLHPPALFNDSIDEPQIDSSPVLLNSEVENMEFGKDSLHKYDSFLSPQTIASPEHRFTAPNLPLKSISDPQEKPIVNNLVSPRLEQELVPLQDEEQDVPLKPPSLFGDGTESLPSAPLPISRERVLVERTAELNESSWSEMDDLNEQQDSPLKPPSLFGDDMEGLPATPLPQLIEERSSGFNKTSWSGIDGLAIKPPSLFGDDSDINSVPSFPSVPTPPKHDKKFIQQHTTQNILSKLHSPVQTSEVRRSSAFELVSRNSAESIQQQEGSILDDDMSSLPPAPPPPSTRVNRSASWSVRSADKESNLSPRTGEMLNISGPLLPAVTERKNSKTKRILPIRIRSKRGRKSSAESEPAFVVSSSKTPLVTGDEPPEDDMESLPPAPPPPRLSPASRSPLTLETMDDEEGLQRAPLLSHSIYEQLGRSEASARDFQEVKTDLEALHPSHHPPKKKSFRRISAQADKELLESLIVGTTSDLPKTDEEKGGTSESPDPSSPPPLPPQMELWAEAGCAEAELALLDQILTLEDSSKSGSEEGSSSLPALNVSSNDVLPIEKALKQVEDVPVFSDFEDRHQTESPLLREDSSTTSAVAASQQTEDDLPDLGLFTREFLKNEPALLPQGEMETGVDRGAKIKPMPDSDQESLIQTEANQLNESYSSIADFAELPVSPVEPLEVPGTASKEDTPSDDREEVTNMVKHRRPAPPIPARPQIKEKTATLPHNSLSTGLTPAAPPVTSTKVAILPNHPRSVLNPALLQKEHQRLPSPAKDKSSKKQQGKKHKGKNKQVDSEHLDAQATPPRERSRSWTKRLFGFRSRSKSRDKSGDKDDRSRSTSPQRRLFSKSRTYTVTPPVTPQKKPPLVELKRGKGKKQGDEGDRKSYREVEVVVPEPPSSESSHLKLTDELLEKWNNKAEEINKPSSSTDYDSAQSSFDSNSLVENNEFELAPHLLAKTSVAQENFYEERTNNDQEVDMVRKTDLIVSNRVASPGVGSIGRSNKPPDPPPKPARTYLEDQLVDLDGKMKDFVQDEPHPRSPVKPPVPKKPQFLKAVSSEQGKSVEEIKHKLDTDLSLESGQAMMRSFPDGASGLNVTDSGKGPPKFKPPPLVDLQRESLPNVKNADKGTDSPTSPGPPSFKPPPPPVGMTQKMDETFMLNKEPLQEEESREDATVLPTSHNFYEQRIMKPLPPIPTDFIPTPKDKSEVNEDSLVGSKTLNHKLPLLPRQYAQEQDEVEERISEDDTADENEEQRLELLLSQLNTTEDYVPSQASQVKDEPVVSQTSVEPVNASGSEGFNDSELSSEWEDSSSQGNAGLAPAVSKLVKSASFSAGDYLTKPSHQADDQQKLVPASIRPPPPMRRRSSSLPGFPPELLPVEEGTNYWHTGNLQELINSRNQEADVDEGIIEVQLLKEQQSIGLMVVGGLDTHLGMLYIKNIQPGSPAAKCERLRVGDQLLQVNDNCLVGVTHGDALTILKNTPPLVKLTVARKQDRADENGLELVAEGRGTSEFDGAIVSTARESSTVSKTSSELTLSPTSERSHRPRSWVSLSSFGTSFSDEQPPVSMYSSFEEPDEYVPAYLEPESPTLNLCQNDVPVTIIDGIPDEEEGGAEEEEEIQPFNKSVRWAVTDEDSEVFTVELLKNDRAGLGLSVSGGVDTLYGDIMVRQILSSSVTAHDGRIKKGDILLSVNGKSFKGLTNTEALALLKDTPNRVSLVLCRSRGPRQQVKSALLLRDKSAKGGISADSDAWPATTKEMTKKKNHVNKKGATSPILETIPLDFSKQNGDHSTIDRVKKKLFSNGGPKSLKERLQKAPQSSTVCEITLEKGASGLGFSLAGGQDSLYGDAPMHVKYVFKESVAGKSGVLKPGDEILEVNGQRVSYMTNVDALELIRKLPYGPVVMKIRRK